MGLEKLARELEETARQTAAMAEGVAAGLAILGDPSLDSQTARTRAAATIAVALQMQDRIDQRCRGIARVAGALAERGPGAVGADAIWAEAGMDELRDDRHARTTRSLAPGDIEVF